MIRFTVLACSIFLAVCFPLRDVSCAAGTPTERVKSILEEVMAIQSNSQPEVQSKNQKKMAIKNIIARNFHFNAMVRQVLGPQWPALSEARRSEFKQIFQDLFQESYTRLVLDFLGREKILYQKEERFQTEAKVSTTILRTNESISVDYSLAAADQKWLIQDVVIDGVSIIRNYQKTFARVIQQETFEGLLKKMRLQQQTIDRSS